MRPSPPKLLGPVTIKRRYAAQGCARAHTRHDAPRATLQRHTSDCTTQIAAQPTAHHLEAIRSTLQCLQKAAHSCSEQQLPAATLVAASALEGAADSVEELGAATLRGERRSSAAGCSECALCALLDVPTMAFHCTAARSTAFFLSAAAFALRSVFAMAAALQPALQRRSAKQRRSVQQEDRRRCGRCALEDLARHLQRSS